jgi:hypothetical protein
MRVICYRNLRRQVWSIAEIRGRNGVGHVIAHQRHVILANVSFVVKEPARRRVIRNRRREVHAWAMGELVETVPAGRQIPITYNPYRAPTFTTRDEQTPIHSSPFVRFTELNGAIAVPVNDAPL